MFASCKEALQKQLNESEYWIQHKNMMMPIKVKCERKENEVFAVFDHDSEARIESTGHEPLGSYKYV